jgi:hypothetical protein
LGNLDLQLLSSCVAMGKPRASVWSVKTKG